MLLEKWQKNLIEMSFRFVRMSEPVGMTRCSQLTFYPKT